MLLGAEVSHVAMHEPKARPSTANAKTPEVKIKTKQEEATRTKHKPL